MLKTWLVSNSEVFFYKYHDKTRKLNQKHEWHQSLFYNHRIRFKHTLIAVYDCQIRSQPKKVKNNLTFYWRVALSRLQTRGRSYSSTIFMALRNYRVDLYRFVSITTSRSNRMTKASWFAPFSVSIARALS